MKNTIKVEVFLHDVQDNDIVIAIVDRVDDGLVALVEREMKFIDIDIEVV